MLESSTAVLSNGFVLACERNPRTLQKPSEFKLQGEREVKLLTFTSILFSFSSIDHLFMILRKLIEDNDDYDGDDLLFPWIK
ncbi:hypothetical protein YC2023_028920 [Brassica napus]